MFFVALTPERKPLGLYRSMREAQEAIAAAEPDVVRQGTYQIHPIGGQRDADQAGLKLSVHYRLEKFDGDYVGQAPVEVIEGEG